MANQDYTTTILVGQTPEEVFNAVTNVRGWWSEEIEGGTARLNDEFRYHYKDVHRCKIKLVEVVPNEKVVWLVLENHFSFTKDETEWKGTKVCFDITKKGDKTQLVFTHIGLVPAYECYDICSNAWGTYIKDSLRKLIETGKGDPNRKEAGVKPLDVVYMYYRLLEHKNDAGLSEIITDDISFNSPFFKGSGAKDFIEGMQRWVKTTKTYTIIKQFVAENDVCVISTINAQSPANNSVSWDTADLFEVRNGKIASINLYLDPQIWGREISK